MMKATLFATKEDIATTREMAASVRKVTEEIRTTLGAIGSVTVKARLIDEEVLKDKKLSGSRMVKILTLFSEQVEGLLSGAREAASQMEESSWKLTGVVHPKEARLSDLSLPEFLTEEMITGDRKDQTPESRRQGKGKMLAETLATTIDLGSTPGSDPGGSVPNPVEGERNRNLVEIFAEMDPKLDISLAEN